MRDNDKNNKNKQKFRPKYGKGRPFKDNERKEGKKRSWEEKPRGQFKDKKSGGYADSRQGKFKKNRENYRKDFEAGEAREKTPRPNLYGFHACREAWLNPARIIQTLYLTESAEVEFAPVMKAAYENGLQRPSITTIDKQKLDFMLPRGAVHQGVALITKPLDEISIQDFIIKSEAQEKTILLLLDQVTDPHNVGAILRSASAFGADGVIMQRKHAPELEGTLAKTASGAVEHIDVAYETNLSRALEELKENGFFVFGLDERGEREIGDIMRNNKDKSYKFVLVLGAEGDGMRRLIRENCDELVRLPTKGAIQSLNVSNAAAVALYALCG